MAFAVFLVRLIMTKTANVNNSMKGKKMKSATAQMSKKFPENEFKKIEQLVDDWPALNRRTVQRWCANSKYPYGLRRGKFWYIHPEQFRVWFADCGPT